MDLTQVIGLNVLSVLPNLSEIGVDMSKWRNAKAFCSWLGLCPGNKISGGKVLDSRTCKVAIVSPPPYVWRHRLWDEAILASGYSTDASRALSS